MSRTMRPKPTYMLVCDLCDEEIDQEGDGELSRGNIIARVSPIAEVNERTRHALICWPQSRKRPEEKAVSYDFHGKCIVALVQDAINTRAQEPQP